MNMANSLSYNKKMRQYELNSKAMSHSHCFGAVFEVNQVAISMCYLSRVSKLFPGVLKVS